MCGFFPDTHQFGVHTNGQNAIVVNVTIFIIIVRNSDVYNTKKNQKIFAVNEYSNTKICGKIAQNIVLSYKCWLCATFNHKTKKMHKFFNFFVL